MEDAVKEIIRIEDAWKTYKLGEVDLTVLKGVTVGIREGSFVAIMGPSGSGKSTLLHIVGALDLPSKGKAFIDGKDISLMGEDELSQIRGQKIGFVFQQFNLIHNLTAIENVILPMVFQGVSDDERKKRAKELLTSLGLEHRLDHKPNEMSGGERQRIAIARALANNPDIIVADEPTGNLDSKTGKEVMDILVDLHRNQKKTIIVVTHDPNIADYTQHTINIKDGVIVKNGKETVDILWEH